MTPKTNKQTKEVNKNKYSSETQKLLEELTTLQYLKLEKYFSNQFDEETGIFIIYLTSKRPIGRDKLCH